MGIPLHGNAVADRFTDKKDLGGGGEFKIEAAQRLPVKGGGWELEWSKEIKAMQTALPSLDL